MFKYYIAGNFRERKLSQFGEKNDFRGENFHGLLAFAASKDTTLPNCEEKTFTNSHKLQNSRKFSPSSVSRYTVTFNRFK